MDRLYLEFPLVGHGEVFTEGLITPAISGLEGHLFVQGVFDWPGGTLFMVGQVYAPRTEAGLRQWFSEFDPSGPGEWAAGCDGNFTLVVREPSKGRGWIIGDRNGQQRFYFSAAGGTLRVGNSLLGVATRMRHPHLSQEGCFHLLALRYSLDPQTQVEGVKATAPGLLFEVGPAGVREIRYYKPVRYDSDYFTSMEECVAGLDCAFRAAFSKRYDPTRRCVVLLSGGIDSVAMLRYLTEVAPGKVEAVTFGIKGDEQGDEVRSAQMAARHFGVPHRLVLIDPADVVVRTAGCFGEADSPHYGGALFRSLRAGILEGSLPVDLYSGQDTRLHTPSLDTPKALGLRLSQMGIAPLNAVWRGTLAATRLWPFRGKRTLAYWRQAAAPGRDLKDHFVHTLLNIGVLEGNPRWDALMHGIPAFPKGAGIQEVFKRLVEFEYLTQWTDDMNDFCTVMGGPGVGIHFPFYDHDLVAACNRIPYAIGARHMFTTRSWSWIPFTQKAVLRRLLLKSVPKELVYRRKATLPTMHLAFNAGLGGVVGRIYDRWGGSLLNALDEYNATHVQRIMGRVRSVTGQYRFPEEHDLAWDAYSVAYLAVLQQILSGNANVVDELRELAANTVTPNEVKADVQ